jgi:hypothetical protein
VAKLALPVKKPPHWTDFRLSPDKIRDKILMNEV